MQLHGQRWQYRIGNTAVIVENAYSIWGWAQERWSINGEVVKATGGWFSFRRTFEEPWLTVPGEGVLEVKLRSAIKDIRCTVLVDGEAIEPEAVLKSIWRGKGSWPLSEEWTEHKGF